MPHIPGMPLLRDLKAGMGQHRFGAPGPAVPSPKKRCIDFPLGKTQSWVQRFSAMPVADATPSPVRRPQDARPTTCLAPLFEDGVS